MQGVQTAVMAMNRPIAMMTHPAMVVKMLWFRKPERDVAVAPSPTKTAEKPSTNRPVRPTTRRIETLPSDNSAMSYPDMSDTYPGNSGRTQGDRNEAAPANKAAINETSTDQMSFVDECCRSNNGNSPTDVPTSALIRVRTW